MAALAITHCGIFVQSNRIFVMIWCGSYSQWTIHCHWWFWNEAGCVFSSHIARPIPLPPQWLCSLLLRRRSFQNWSSCRPACASDLWGRARFCKIWPISFSKNSCWQALIKQECTLGCWTLCFCWHSASWSVCCCGRSSFQTNQAINYINEDEKASYKLILLRKW